MSTPTIPAPAENWTMTIATYVAPNEDGTFAAYIQIVAQGPGDRGLGQLIPVPTVLDYSGFQVQGPNAYETTDAATTAIELAIGSIIPVNHMPTLSPPT